MNIYSIPSYTSKPTFKAAVQNRGNSQAQKVSFKGDENLPPVPRDVLSGIQQMILATDKTFMKCMGFSEGPKKPGSIISKQINFSTPVKNYDLAEVKGKYQLSVIKFIDALSHGPDVYSLTEDQFTKLFTDLKGYFNKK